MCCESLEWHAAHRLWVVVWVIAVTWDGMESEFEIPHIDISQSREYRNFAVGQRPRGLALYLVHPANRMIGCNFEEVRTRGL